MILCLVISAIIANTVVGELCNVYEVSGSTRNPEVISPKIFGLYKIDYRKICRGKPVYKHVIHDRYIYARDNKWLVGVLQNENSCDFVPYSYGETRMHIWRYWDKNNLFTGEMKIKLTCICGIVQVINDNAMGSLNQPEILGTYEINSQYRCNNHSTYKHIQNNFYIHVSSNNKWVISNGKSSNKDSTNLCLRNGVAFNPGMPVSNVPNKRGWRMLESSTNRWRIDTSLSAICTCNAFKVTAALSTVMAGKNNLTGTYEIYNKKRQCNGRQIFKHSHQEYFLYVDTDDTWIIGGTRELALCKNFGYAYSAITPALDTPSSSSWKYYNYIRDSWCTDPEMTITCV